MIQEVSEWMEAQGLVWNKNCCLALNVDYGQDMAFLHNHHALLFKLTWG